MNVSENILFEARKYALQRNTFFITSEFLLAGLLNSSHELSGFLNHLNRSNLFYWIDMGGQYYVIEEAEAPDLVPLTKETEILIKMAFDAYPENSPVLAHHLLLAITSYENPASEILLREGIMFEDVYQYAMQQGLISENFTLNKYFYYQTSDRNIWVKYFILKIFPNETKKNTFGVLLLNMIISYRRQREYARVKKYISLYERLLGVNLTTTILRGIVCLEEKKYKEAIAYFEECLNEDPKNFDHYFNLSLPYWELNDFKKAEWHLKKSIEVNPNNPMALNNLGFLYIKMEEFNLAEKNLKLAIESDNKFAFAYNNLAYIRYRQENYDESLLLIEKSLSIDKGNSYAYKNRALVYFKTDKISLGCQELDQATKYGFEKMYGSEVNDLRKKYCMSANN